MKINGFKFVIALALSLLLGFVCEIIAPETESRNWISLAIGFVSIASMIIPAMGLQYENAKRGVSIKVFSWIMAIVVIATNIILSCFEYKVDIYIVVALLLAVIGWGAIWGLLVAKSYGQNNR